MNIGNYDSRDLLVKAIEVREQGDESRAIQLIKLALVEREQETMPQQRIIRPRMGHLLNAIRKCDIKL